MADSLDLTLIDGFEKIRSYLLETEPDLEASVFAPPRQADRWTRLPPVEYHEAFLSTLLGIDRQTAAGRRAIRAHLQSLRERAVADGPTRVAEASPSSHSRRLFRPDRHEQRLRENAPAIAEALQHLTPDGGGRLALIEALAGERGLREAVARVRKTLRPLGGLRAFEFLAQIGYPVVVPDPARQRFFHRLGWIRQTVAAPRHPQEFLEVCERLEHLTGQALPVINAATGLFAGSRDVRAAGHESPAVCLTRPRCEVCVLTGQCAYYRYRGAPQPAVSRGIKAMAVAEQPRTRFETLGPEHLGETELLALVIRTGAQGKSSLDLAREILERFGSLDALSRAGLGEMCKIKGIGRAKAIEIKAALELGRRLQSAGPVLIGEPIRRSGDLFALYRGLLAREQQENFYLIVLTARHRIQSHFLISRGSLTASLVHPREVLKVAVREAAGAIAFVHNHPSGEPEPSEDDRDITERLVRAARLFTIPVLDHVIIGRDDFFSFADHNLLGDG